jgi:mannose-6-phosphate isomerase
VFSAAGRHDHADRLFESLRTRFADPTHGGWFYSIDAQGAPRDTVKDLYTHAFVIFACAEYFKHGGNRDALDLLEATLHVVETRFAADAGLYNAALSDDFKTIVDGPLQNPIMHLTEAYLAARGVQRDTWFDDALARMGEQIVATFVHRPTGCIAELPIGRDGNRIEPGHQFEWFYLVSSAPSIFDASELPAWLATAYRFAHQYGVSPSTGGVCAALDETGRVTDPVERIWAQTEYARALATWRASPDHAALPAELSLDEQLGRLRQRFLRDYGWVECIAPDGGVVRADMPSTTPYHLMSAYLAIAALGPAHT